MNADRFVELWRRLGVSDTWARELFAEVDAHYGSAGRHYHTGGHIEHCLARFDEIRHLLEHPDAVELALWFHDVIYELGADDNERQSAAYFLDKTQKTQGTSQEATERSRGATQG